MDNINKLGEALQNILIQADPSVKTIKIINYKNEILMYKIDKTKIKIDIFRYNPEFQLKHFDLLKKIYTKKLAKILYKEVPNGI